MFVYLDVPYLPLPNLPIITLQDQSDKTKKGNEASSKLEQKFNFIYKECREFEDTMAEDSAERVLIPALSLANYFALKSNYKREFDYRDIKTSILQEPKHGELTERIDNKGNILYTYDPEPGYLGKDSAVFVAEFNGKRYKITTELRVVRPHAGESNCPPNRLIKVGQFTPTPNDYKVTFSDLTGSAVGETNGQGRTAQITLDSNAAGHGWFIDDTPDNNDEFLPTADPEVWIAKAGTAAAGKMDMLSVLLHEYGHALGIEHSGDNADYMAASLQPGQRRLPSTEELSLMSRLVAALKGGTDDPNDPMNPNLPLSSLGLMALCRIRRADYGWTLGVDKAQLVSRVDVNNLLQNANQPAQLQTVVNSTLNQDSSAWQTTGNIGNTDGNVTLAESATSNTHLSQSFAVKQGDRYLSFTVANNHLQSNGVDEDGNGNGPNDAFEVALLNANTGLSVAGTTGLSRSDALLNIQTDGTQSRAASVRKVRNADGSDTYYVDLQQAVNESNGLVTGTPVTLSFDLMGFGAQDSQVSLRDIKLVQDPVAFDDVVTSDEDATATIAVLSNDLLGGGVTNNAAQISIVNQPTHGSITINADGTISYVPAAHFYDTDSFTYTTTVDGRVSNQATVSLNVRHVNHAPVVSTDNVAMTVTAGRAVEISLIVSNDSND